MSKRFRKSSATKTELFKGKHRFEHWYRDNSVYFITSRCRDRFAAFATEEAKLLFWDRFQHYSEKYGFVPWITSLLDNHYHTIGYLKIGENLGPFMQKFHGSVAKLVNDTLDVRLVPFWRTAGNQDYFDGCLRDEQQATRAYRYTLKQAIRHGIVSDYRDYPHTRVNIEMDRAIKRATALKASLYDVPYARYQRTGRLSDQSARRDR
jgi:REP element-mobilizing transposase RayT